MAQTLTVVGEAKDTVAVTEIRQKMKANTAKGYTTVEQIKVKSAAMIWAEQQAKKKDADAQNGQRRREQLSREQEIVEKVLQRAAQSAAEDAKTNNKSGEEQNDQNSSSLTFRKNLKQGSKQSLDLQSERERCQNELNAIVQTGQILFAAGSEQLSAASFATLDRFAEAKELCRNNIIEIAGHTDSKGTEEVNKSLSEKRARAVRNYLIDIGMPAAQLIARGYGESRPLVDNLTAENRARNRRIEFYVSLGDNNK